MTPTQTDPFIPLTHAAALPSDRQEYDVTVVTQAERAQLFKPLTLEPTTVASGAPARHGQGCDPQISLQRQGDVVTGIRVICGCGQTIDLACIFSEPAR